MKWWKVTLVVFGAVLITALGIDAADTMTGKGGTLLSQVIKNGESCGRGMVSVDAVPNVTCVDQFEVSAGEGCPVQNPSNLIESQKNTDTKGCDAVSEKGSLPWSFVTRDQALRLCSRAGKRLPSASEWYALSLGMSDFESACNISSKKVWETGSHDTCTAPHGAYDLIGNLWEWVSDDVINGSYNNRILPQNGYVEQVDSGGVALVTRDIEDSAYGNDYFWASNDGAYGMVRGGYYDSGDDAGMYTIHADTPTNAASIGIGFRCVK